MSSRERNQIIADSHLLLSTREEPEWTQIEVTTWEVAYLQGILRVRGRLHETRFDLATKGKTIRARWLTSHLRGPIMTEFLRCDPSPLLWTLEDDLWAPPGWISPHQGSRRRPMGYHPLLHRLIETFRPLDWFHLGMPEILQAFRKPPMGGRLG